VYQLHRSRPDDEQVARGLAVHDQRELTGAVGVLRGGGGDPLELLVGERVERRVAPQEFRDVGKRAQAADSTTPSSTR
jgi:hypothetical protein